MLLESSGGHTVEGEVGADGEAGARGGAADAAVEHLGLGAEAGEGAAGTPEHDGGGRGANAVLGRGGGSLRALADSLEADLDGVQRVDRALGRLLRVGARRGG